MNHRNSVGNFPLFWRENVELCIHSNLLVKFYGAYPTIISSTFLCFLFLQNSYVFLFLCFCIPVFQIGPYFDKIDHRHRRIICNPLTEIRQLPIVYFDMQTVIALAYIKLRYHALNSTAICQLLYWSVHYTNAKSCMHPSTTIVQVLHHRDSHKH